MIRLFLSLIAAGFMSSAALAQVCDPSPEKHAVRIQAQTAMETHPPSLTPEVFGDHDFFQVLGNGWLFALIRTELGWSIRLYDSEPIGDGVDLTATTPPLRGAPNPRDIEGWHFRNADNTGPNLGDVNAPQMMRAFVISPGLAGTGGLRLPDEPIEPGPNDGIGWLNILDLGLDNSGPGDRARLNYLKFDACVSWPRRLEETTALLNQTSLDFLPEERETFGSCGLPLDRFELSATFFPRQLGGDIDGDGSLDEVAPIMRKSDGQRGLALCRAGTWLDTIGLDAGIVSGLRPGFVSQTEAWQWVSQDDTLPRHLTGYDMPEADGDYLILERIEKEAMVIYWQDGSLKAKRMYGHVEP